MKTAQGYSGEQDWQIIRCKNNWVLCLPDVRTGEASGPFDVGWGGQEWV